MKLTFDYYHNLEKVELYLCNPDGRELFPLPGKNRHINLRFNDLSELTFDVDSKITLSDNTVVELDAYDFIQTKRLVYATNIGWFQITSVDENDNGVVKYKSVTTESYQSVLKNKGFISEERVYCFYNPNDPHDDRYDSMQEDSIPSVIGQWSKQLGIKIALGQGLAEPSTPYDDWTVTYIHSSLTYTGAGSICRTFKDNITYGYDWIVNDVEDAFEVVVLFDFMYKTIHVMTPSEVTQRVNVLYTFNNFMKNIDITEDAENIVTVLNCNGDNCDITAVNPTGTNYICDFSYYMDKTNYRWMSSELINKIEAWKSDCDDEKETYTDYVAQLRSLYQQQAECTTELQEMSLSLTDLRTAQNKRSVLGNGTPGAICGIVCAETVKSGSKSIKSGTNYYSTAFTGDKRVTAYQFSPSYDAENKVWVFSGASTTGTASSIVADNLSDTNTSGISYWYFTDVSDGSSYCKLKSAVTVNKDTVESSYYCDGFDRYIAYSYPLIDEANGTTTYTDNVQEWITLRESIVATLNRTDASLQASIDSVSASLDAISSRLNILSYFADTPRLLRELNCYWIEGDYTNENIAVLDETTLAEEIDLSNELLDSGYIELSKVCQPRLSFSIESVDATKNYEFRHQMKLLELGKIITIEKEEGLWYYPALLEISMNLDNSDEFDMKFANAMRLDDWGYTYADLMSDAAATSRKVSANWQEILAYAKERENITSLIKDPLDMTLKASFANMVNQDFIIDKTGILGRKRLAETSDDYEDEQIRLINNLLIFTDDNWETAKTALGKIYYQDDDGNTISTYGLIAETIIGSLIMGERLKIKNTDSTIELGAEGISIKQADGTVVFQAGVDGSLIVHNYATNSDLAGAVETLNAALELKADSASLSVYAKTEYVDGKVEDLQSSLDLKADSASLSVYAKTEEVEDALSGYVTTETMNSQLELKADTASLSTYITKTTADSTYASKSSLTTLQGEINAKVDETYGSSSSAFGWSLKTSGFYIYSNKKTVMKVTSTGLEIDGKGTFSGSIVATNDITSDNKTLINEHGIYFGNAFSENLPSYMGDSEYSISNDSGSWAMYNIDIYGVENITVTKTAYNSNGLWFFKGWTITPDSMTYRADYSGSDPFSFSGTKLEIPFIKITRGVTTGSDAFLQFWSTNSNMYASLYMDHDDDKFMLYSWHTAIGIGNAAGKTNRLMGTWWYSGAEIKSSDRNVKNSISDFSEQYDVLFDNLTPRVFKYNDGLSNRLHSGYIAQEVADAVTVSGLTSSDFAAVCVDNPNTPKELWGLRYDEFVSLNTWQIQKLKRRVAELERIVEQLKTT